MPRQAHGRPVSLSAPARPAKRKPAKGRGLNALQIAEEQNPDTYKIRRHRLGESVDDDDDSNTQQDADERTSKRRKTTGEQDGQQSDSGSDPGGERWHVGVEEDDEDSDIDSDDAFGESDEDKFADFTFRGSEQGKNKKTRRKGTGEDEEEEFDDPDAIDDIADDFGDDAIDLAAALDADSEEEPEQRETAKKRKRMLETTSEDDDGSGESSDEAEVDEDSDGNDDGDSDVSTDPSDLFASDEEAGDHTRLQNFVENLSREKNEDSKQPVPSSAKVSAADLLQYVKDPQQRQSLKVLQNSESKGPEVYKGGIPGRLAAPLAKRQQDKLDRVAAYGESKKELDKWVDTVKHNRRAEHISFPLVDPSDAPSRNDLFMPVGSTKPMNELEAKIQDIMRESGQGGGATARLGEEEEEYEELAEHKLSPEEIKARRAELRRNRDLMFREELRAKRVKKIKSKAYRRVHRKEREKAALERRAELAADGLLDSEDEKEHNDKRRAEERMGSRHRESKWAKGAKAAGRTIWDEDARVGVTDMARRDDELRRRIEGKTAGESDNSDSEFDGYSSDEADDDIQRRLNDEKTDSPVAGGSRLADMAFMKKAEAGRRAANDAQLQAIRREMRADGGDVAEDSDAEGDDTYDGRQKFGNAVMTAPHKSTKTAPKIEFEEPMSADGDDDIALNAPILATTSEKSIKAPATGAKPSMPKKLDTKGDKRMVTKAEFENNQKRQNMQSKTSSIPQMLDDHVDESDDGAAAEIFDADGDGAQVVSHSVFMGPDDVVQEFEQEKQDLVKEEGDQIIDNSLPGWGSWGGTGISKKSQQRNKNRFVTKVKGIAPEVRKDAKLDKVIINEKRVKKNGKYLATELPHPYESRSQYERAMRLPLGPEWTTKSTFQDATKPRVLVKQGVIKPMSRPMV